MTTPPKTETEIRIKALVDSLLWMQPNSAQIHGTSQVAYEIASEINALRAEVERLRPAAEAWEAHEVWLNSWAVDGERTLTAYEIAAVRARAAKGGQS